MNGLGSNAGRLVRWLPAAIAIAHAASLWGVVPVDDDFIVYRYARNLLEHGELCFNEGAAASDGVTTVGWLLLVLAAVALGVPPEWWSPLVRAAAFAACAAVTARAAARLAGSNGPGLAAGLMVAPLPRRPGTRWRGLDRRDRSRARRLRRAWTGGVRERGRFGGRRAPAEGRAQGLRAGRGGRGAPASRDRVRCGWLRCLAEPAPRRDDRAAARRLRGPLRMATVDLRTSAPAAASLKALPLADEIAYGWAYASRSLGEEASPFSWRRRASASCATDPFAG